MKIALLWVKNLVLLNVMGYMLPVNLIWGKYMVQKNLAKNSLPSEISEMVVRLGEHIRIARKRRGLTMKEMASRMFVTRKTLSRLENGHPGVSLSVFVLALWVLGLHDDLQKIALPEQDKVGIFYEHKRLPKRVRSTQADDDLDF